MHIRAQIRAALAGLFAADVASGTLKSVETDRVHALDDAKMPCLVIGWSEERADPRSSSGVVRVIRFTIDAFKAGAPLQDGLDALCLLVEQRLAADPDLGGLVMHAAYAGADIEVSGEGEKRIGKVAIAVTVKVATAHGDPETRN